MGWSHLKSEEPHQQTDSRHIERRMDGLVFRESCPPQCTVTEPGKRGKRCLSYCRPACRPIVYFCGLSFPLLLSFCSCSQQCIIHHLLLSLSGGGLSRLGRLGPGPQGAAGAAPSCPDLQRHLRWSNFLKPPSLLPPPSSDTTNPFTVSAESHSLCLAVPSNSRLLVFEIVRRLPPSMHRLL